MSLSEEELKRVLESPHVDNYHKLLAMIASPKFMQLLNSAANTREEIAIRIFNNESTKIHN